jgi:hypothetical protein
VICPVAAAAMATVSEKFPIAPGDTGLVKVHTIVPAAPTAGVVQVAPAGGTNDTNVVFAGVGMSITTPVSAQKPPTQASVADGQLAGVVQAVLGEPFWYVKL